MHSKNATRQALFALGFLSIGTQIYLVREFMMVFNDNELVVGLVLATWMLITGIGSFLGRFSRFVKTKPRVLILFIVLTGILPSYMVAGVDLMRVSMIPYGSMADLWHIESACVLMQLPFCLLNGFLFSFLSTFSVDSSPSVLYAWESLGSMVSGMLINFLFLWFLGPFQGLLTLTAVYFFLTLYFTWTVAGKKMFYVVLSISMAYLVYNATIDFRRWAEKKFYASQHVISNHETPYGQVVVTQSMNQFNFFENSQLLFSTGNMINNEENVHYAMVQHPSPANILLISGGFSGTLSEILKYKPVHIDYVELDPSLIRIASRFTRQLGHPSIQVHATDARRFINDTKTNYDVVLVNLPAPATLQLNRYYSVDFLRNIRKKMTPGAVIAFNLPTGTEYVSGKAGNLNSVLWNTLKHCFHRVLILPAGRNYFLASDSALSLDVPGLIQARKIETTYVNKYYLDAVQLKERSEFVTGSVTASGSVNSDFNPSAVWYQMSWWMSHFKVTHAFFLIVFLAILVMLLLTLNPVNAGLFAGGFTLASLEIILIFGLQILFGYLFQAIGAIIMIFMLGLAAGSGMHFIATYTKTVHLYKWLQISLAVCALLAPMIIHWLNDKKIGDWPIHIVFALLAFIAAFIVGMEYRVAFLLSKSTLQRAVAGNYSAEMFGSAAGAFSVTLFLIPLLGMVNTGIILALLNLATVGSLFMVRQKI